MIGLKTDTGSAVEKVTRFSGPSDWIEDSDSIVTEEPMEIRLDHDGKNESIAVTMRTPVNDKELALGFLFTEGFVKASKDVISVEHSEGSNVVSVTVRDGITPVDRSSRNFYMSSSCGVCGKSSINEIYVRGVRTIRDNVKIDSHTLVSLPERMRENQRLFKTTGGIHAASVFDTSGNHLVTMEDIGRHNAVDKCIGFMFSNDIIGRSNIVMQISGRGGFEILQKAAMARIPIVSSVSAPSSLAIEVAQTFGITLACFVRDNRFNVYTNPERIIS